jgi:hypothetical protein
MLQIAFALTLLAIVAGMMLLAYSKKENLGNLYKYVSWFVIVTGFLSILCIGARCGMRCCQMGKQRMMAKERMMMMNDEGCMMGHMGWRMMGHHRGMMGGCGMMGGGCCGGMMNGHMDGCCQGMSQCHEGMGQCGEGMSECHEGMGGCTDGKGECSEGKDGGSCPMMKGGMMEKKDTVVKKK